MKETLCPAGKGMMVRKWSTVLGWGNGDDHGTRTWKKEFVIFLWQQGRSERLDEQSRTADPFPISAGWRIP